MFFTDKCNYYLNKIMFFIVLFTYYCLLNRNPGLGTPFCYVNNGTDYVKAYCNVAQCEGGFFN